MIVIKVKSNYKECTSDMTVDVISLDVCNMFSRLSPYYPHGNIPIPNTFNQQMRSVNDVWQNLCVKDVSFDIKLDYKTVKFRKGLNSTEYWNIREARHKILIPVYCWMLENNCLDIISYLRVKSKKTDIVLLDSSMNCNIDNIEEPLSCAFLLKAYIEGTYPYCGSIKEKTICRPVMLGRKEINVMETIFEPRKIANVYTGEQGILDF